MTENQYKPPKFLANSFTCPYCRIVTTQIWSNDKNLLNSLFNHQYQMFLDYRGKIDSYDQRCISKFLNEIKPEFLSAINRPYFLATCSNTDCGKFSFWVDQKMVYPSVSTAPPPHEDMPENVKKTYEEARQVQPYSVRASAALLRVSLEQLTAHLGETKGSLYKRIENLKKKGLPSQVIENLDIIKEYGNEGGAHAGIIDLENKDNEYVLDGLFMLVNTIVEKTITENKKAKELKAILQKAKKAGIENRDSK